jgi:hypothetical protein
MRFVEDRVRIRVADVAPAGGWLGPGAPFLLLNGREIEITRDCEGLCRGRAWLICPRCRSRRRHLYLPEIACRVCLDLRYSCRHGVTRRLRILVHIARWRRLIGANPKPFSPIKRNPHGRRRYQDRVRLIRLAEGMLLGQLAEINDAAERAMLPRSAGSAPAMKRKRPTR